jgi:hypothetical protein
LPPHVQKQIRKAGIDPQELNDPDYFEILLNVLRFATKQFFRLKKKVEKETEAEIEQAKGYNLLTLPGTVESDSAPPALLLKTGKSSRSIGDRMRLYWRFYRKYCRSR